MTKRETRGITIIFTCRDDAMLLSLEFKKLIIVQHQSFAQSLNQFILHQRSNRDVTPSLSDSADSSVLGQCYNGDPGNI